MKFEAKNLVKRRKQKNVFFCILLMLAFLYSFTSLALPKNNTKSEENLKILEEKVWTSTSVEFFNLENEIISKLNSDPKSEKIHFLLSVLYLNYFKENKSDLKKLNKSFELSQQLVALNPKSSFAYLSIAYTKYILGLKEKAQLNLDRINDQKSKKTWRFYFLESLLNFSQKNMKNKLETILDLLKSKKVSQNIISKYFLDKINNRDNLSKSIHILKNFIDKHNLLLLNSLLAKWYIKNQEFVKAEKIYKKMIASKSIQTDEVIDYAHLLMSHFNAAPKAVKVLKNYLAFVNTDSEKKQINYHLSLALILNAQKQEAFKILKTLLSSESRQNLDPTFNFLIEYNQFETAIELIDFINFNFGGSAYLYAVKGDIFYHYQQKYNDAITAYENSLILKEDNHIIHNRLGFIFYDQSHYDKALEQFKKSSLILDSQASTSYNIACILSLKGETRSSLSYLEKAFSQNPNLVAKALVDKDLLGLRTNPIFKQILKTYTSDLNITKDLDSL